MQIEILMANIMILNYQLPHKIQLIVNNIGNMKDISYIILNMALGVGAFKGLEYLKSFKEKKATATFTFWSQLRVRMVEIKSWLDSDKSLINCLYGIRDDWESESGSDGNRIDYFKELTQETLRFIKSSSDQMPAYPGWTDDYNKFISFLTDIILFDISNGEKYFKFEENCSISERNNYVNEICNIIKRLCKEIESKQKEIENNLC